MKNQIELITCSREIELLDSKRKIIIQELFTEKGMDLIISEIEKEVENFSADISTKQGQASIKSMAAKVARCKSPIKDLAMELKEDSRKLINDVNSQYNRYEAAMDALRNKIRKPVDEIEEREAKLLAERKERIERIKNHRMLYNSTLQDIEIAINNVKEIVDFDNWGEFQFAAESAAKEVIEQLEVLFKQKEEQIKKDAELEQLRKEAAERAQKDHEEKIAKEAAEKAKREAEEIAERERKVEENRRLQTEEDARRAEQDKKDAEERAKNLEKLLADREEKRAADEIIMEKRKREVQAIVTQDVFCDFPMDIQFKISKHQFLLEPNENIWQESLKEICIQRDKILEDRLLADKKAKEDLEKVAAAAVEAERERVEAQRKADETAAEKLAANKRHCAKIELEAIEDVNLILGINQKDIAKIIIDAISKNKIRNILIKY